MKLRFWDHVIRDKDAPPEIAIFLGGIVGLVQGLGMTLKQKNRLTQMITPR